MSMSVIVRIKSFRRDWIFSRSNWWTRESSRFSMTLSYKKQSSVSFPWPAQQSAQDRLQARPQPGLKHVCKRGCFRLGFILLLDVAMGRLPGARLQQSVCSPQVADFVFPGPGMLIQLPKCWVHISEQWTPEELPGEHPHLIFICHLRGKHKLLLWLQHNTQSAD